MKLVIISLILFVLQLIDAYGESYNGIPSLQEREAINLVNLARMSPKSYSAQFFNNNENLWDKNESPILVGYEKTHPVYLDEFLSSYAMTMSVGKHENNTGFASNKCEGSKIANGTYTGTSDAVVFVNTLLCGPYVMSHYRNNQPKTICSSDFQNDFSRQIIMDSDWYSYGVGYNSQYWSYVFRNNETCPSPAYPSKPKDVGKIYSGFHSTASTIMTIPNEDGYLESSVFFANYYSDIPISGNSMNLIVNENSETIYVGRAFGNSTFGVYMTSLPFNDKYRCAPYYFESTDINGQVNRYPTTGFLQFTRDETECPSFVEEIKPTRRPTKRPTKKPIPTPTPTRTSTPTHAPTRTPYPTKTSIPTRTPSTPRPTFTSSPTKTPYPTNSTTPTNTPTSYDSDSFTMYDYIIVFVFCIFVVSTIISSTK